MPWTKTKAKIIDYSLPTGAGCIGTAAGSTVQAELEARVKQVNGKTPVAGAVTLTTGDIQEGTSLYLTATRVLNTTLVGLSVATNAVISAADSVLTSLGKLQAQVTGNTTQIGLKANKANDTLTKPTIVGYIEKFQALNPGAAVTVDPDLGTLIEIITTVSATAINLPPAVAGLCFTVMVKYGATGHTISFAGGTALRPTGGTVPAATSVGGKIDLYSMICGTGYTIIRDGGRNA